MAEVGRRLAREFHVSVVDINFGCPVSEVTEKAHSGSYLLRDPDRVGQIVAAVANACAPTPVTAKIRLGAAAIRSTPATLPRPWKTPAEPPSRSTAARPPTCSAVRPIGKRFPASSRYLYRIPLIGNGDITTPQAVVEAFRRYDVDGVMIGRAALNRPWLFRQAQAALCGEPIPPDPSLAEQRAMMIEHFRLLAGRFGQQQATVLMRKFACCYAASRPGAGPSARMSERWQRQPSSSRSWKNTSRAKMLR